MNEVRARATQAFAALPMVHRVTLVAVAIGLVMGSVAFASWISAPEMTILASGLDDADLAQVVDELEAGNVNYEIGAGGSSVLVDRDQLYTVRAQMATSGIVTGDQQDGWEILDDQGIAISDFQQQANYQRALEGELSRTLTAMDGIDAATVHLVLPEDRLFTEQQEQRTASVLLDTSRGLGPDEVEAVVFLTSSAVEGLESGGVTVADADGTVLHSPGETGGVTTGANRQLRETREYEQAIAGDIQRLLTTATGSTASVVVRANLDFDATETSQRTLDPDGQVATSEQTIDEEYTGNDPTDEGVVGIDGGPVDGAAAGASTDYKREEVLREYGVSETTTTTVQAPGKVDGLSVAIVMDDGTLTGVTVPEEAEVAELVAAAVGLDEARGDSIAVSRVPFPEATDAEMAESGLAGSTIDLASRIGAVAVFVVVAVALFLMSRRRDSAAPEVLEGSNLPELAAGVMPTAGEVPMLDDGDAFGDERVLHADARPVDDELALGRRTPPTPPVPPDDTARREVEALVERQPEEIANLLRGWLADTSS